MKIFKNLELTIGDIILCVVIILWIISALIAQYIGGDIACTYTSLIFVIIFGIITILKYTSINFNIWLNKKL